MRKELLKTMVFAVLILAFAWITPGKLVANAATKPAKVTGLTVVDQDDDEINLSWNSVSGAKGYQIFQYDSTSKTWVLIQTTSRTYTEVENLKSAKKYRFKVRAYSVTGATTTYGAKSDALAAYTEPAEVKRLTASATTETTVTLTWKKVTRATKYQVFLYDNTKGKYVRKTTVSSTSTVISGLTSGTTYKFKVRAYTVGTDGVRYYGDYSDSCKVRTTSAASSTSSGTGTSTTANSSTATASGSYIGSTRAKSIALADASVKESAVYDLEVEFDWEKGVAVYEVSFDYDGYEYDYEINATTGAILEKKVERD